MFGLFDIHYNEFKPEQTLLGSSGNTSTFDTNSFTIDRRKKKKKKQTLITHVVLSASQHVKDFMKDITGC